MSARHASRPDETVWPEPIYLDASALVKLFVPEAGSEALNDALLDAADVIVSDLALTEMASALGRRIHEGRLVPAAGQRLQREAEKLGALCRRVESTPPIHRRAEQLLLASRDVPLRALDALHIATALDSGAATVVSFDPRLRAVAAAQSLRVAPDTRNDVVPA